MEGQLLISLFKTTFSLKTRNWPMNFAMLLKYYMGKILPIQYLGNIYS